jgi:hypothetical protein
MSAYAQELLQQVMVLNFWDIRYDFHAETKGMR